MESAFKILSQDCTLMTQAKQAWEEIQERVTLRATKVKNNRKVFKDKPKVFEVWHEMEVARLSFLDAIVTGKSIEDAKFTALDRIKIGYTRNTAGRFLRWED